MMLSRTLAPCGQISVYVWYISAPLTESQTPLSAPRSVCQRPAERRSCFFFFFFYTRTMLVRMEEGAKWLRVWLYFTKVDGDAAHGQCAGCMAGKRSNLSKQMIFKHRLLLYFNHNIQICLEEYAVLFYFLFQARKMFYIFKNNNNCSKMKQFMFIMFFFFL